jgi:hypothetical protein
VNVKHVKNVPDRKTDARNAEWLADLLRHGLLRGSFILERQCARAAYHSPTRRVTQQLESLRVIATAAEMAACSCGSHPCRLSWPK